jgi:hypothetical protein
MGLAMSIVLRLLIVAVVFAAATVAAYFAKRVWVLPPEAGSTRSVSALSLRLPELLGGMRSRSGHNQTETRPSAAFGGARPLNGKIL